MPVGWCDSPRSVLPDRQWRALYEATTILIDEALGDLVDLRAGTDFADLVVASYLPSRYLPRYDEDFLRRFLVCLTSVGLKLRLPGSHPLGCTAEELALHAVIERARQVLEEVDDENGEDQDEEGEQDEEELDFSEWEELAFEDTDFAFLFRDATDGIEDTPAGQVAGIGHLRYDEWFLPFNLPRVMHPYADQGEVAPWQADHDSYAPEETGKDADDEDAVEGRG